MYHITQELWPDEIALYPRKRGRYRAMAESTIKRICVCPTVEGCLAALGCCLQPDRPASVYKTYAHAIPADESVGDATVTGEHWILKPAKFFKIDIIPIDVINSALLQAISPGDILCHHLQRRFMEAYRSWILDDKRRSFTTIDLLYNSRVIA
jgi:hypothetical protein